MAGIETIKEAIEALPDEDYIKLRQWFSEKDWRKWDSQIQKDSEAGELDFLIGEASKEKNKGKLLGL